MNDQLYAKRGEIISKLATYFYELEPQSMIMSVSAMSEYYDCARGTIQNSISFLLEKKCIELEYHGKNGTIIKSLDKGLLYHYKIKKSLTGSMPLPYSKKYEGMATALYQKLYDVVDVFNIAYVRGSKTRADMINNCQLDFAVMSKKAFESSLNDGLDLEVIVEFGKGSYLTNHIILYNEFLDLFDGAKVAIDHSSQDQELLTIEFCKEHHVDYINTPGHNIINLILNKEIDFGIWNKDEVIEKGYNLNFKEIEFISDFSNAVIVCKSSNDFAKEIIRKYINKNEIIAITNDVCSGKLVPQY